MESRIRNTFLELLSRVWVPLRAALAAVLISCGAAFVWASWNWPLVGDAPLIHYVVFLISHGFVPYREIVDLNQPGTLAIEASVMWLGSGAFAWRMFDLALLGAIGVSTGILCRIRARGGGGFAALLAAVTFALIHGRDGLIQTGQRDLVIAALLSGTYALFFLVLRDRSTERYGLSLGAGLCLGGACAVKPHVVLLVPMLLALVMYKLSQRRWLTHLGTAGAGFLLPLIASLAFLLRKHALGAFLSLMMRLGPYHSSLWRVPPRKLLLGSVSSVLLPVFCLWLVVFVAERRWRLFGDQALLLGFLFGLFSYYLQGRGYPYHRYTSEVFLLILAATAFNDVLQARAVPAAQPWVAPLLVKCCALAGVLFAACVIVPRSLIQIVHFDTRDEFGQLLRADLKNLGGQALAGKVQCLDMAGGCIAALYEARLVQSSGLLYDCYLYPQGSIGASATAERDRYRSAFSRAFLARRPTVLIVSSDECGPADLLYRKLDRWPWLSAELEEHYKLARDRRPEAFQRWGGRPAYPYGYRLYQLTKP